METSLVLRLAGDVHRKTIIAEMQRAEKTSLILAIQRRVAGNAGNRDEA